MDVERRGRFDTNHNHSNTDLYQIGAQNVAR